MRVALAVVLAAVVISGCGHSQVESSPSAVAKSTAAVASPAASTDAQVPADDPSLPHQDRAGHLPGDVVLALIDATQRHDWRAAYALHATPPLTSYKVFVKESSEADESYKDFAVLETRVVGVGKGKGGAIVRVTYTCETTPPGGQRYIVVVKAPGQWWSVRKVGGLWRVAWLAGQ
jgi:hypothetical protein